MTESGYITLAGKPMLAVIVVGTLTTILGYAVFVCWQKHFASHNVSTIVPVFAYALDERTTVTSGLAALCGYFLPGFILYAFLLIAHEACHGFAFLQAGAKPWYGFKMVSGVPVLYTAAPEARLSRRQFLGVILLPTVAINAGGLIALALLSNTGSALPVALDLHLGSCAGDWWMFAVVLRLPRSTQFEDTGEGFRFFAENNGPVALH